MKLFNWWATWDTSPLTSKEYAEDKTPDTKPKGHWCEKIQDTYYPELSHPSWNYCPHCGMKIK